MIRLPDEVKRVMDETYNQKLKKPIKVIELPCTDNHKWKEPAYVQINHVGDQKVSCPICGKNHYLTWSKIGNHKYA